MPRCTLKTVDTLKMQEARLPIGCDFGDANNSQIKSILDLRIPKRGTQHVIEYRAY